MNRQRTAVVAGAAVALVLTAGAAFALSDGIQGAAGDDPLSIVLQPTSTDDSTTDSTTPTTDSTSPTTDSTSPTTDSTIPTQPTDGTGAPAAGGIGVDQATAIALAHLGGGSVSQVERELEHGRLEWKVRIVHAGTEWEVRVDDGTGTVTRVKDRDSSGGDDKYDDHDKDDDHSGKGRGRGGDDH